MLELILKSLCLQVSDWTDEFDVAIKTADPSHHRPEWRLGDGFTAAEGFDILPDCSVPCFVIRQLLMANQSTWMISLSVAVLWREIEMNLVWNLTKR